VVKAWQAWWAREQEQFKQRGITDEEITAEAVEKVFGKAVQVTEWAKDDDVWLI
jgi:hypothetical protein